MINDFENSLIENIDNQNDNEKEIISFLLSNGISAEKSKMITEKLYYPSATRQIITFSL